ncbi:MAG: type II toxin-antitoxin system VapC family toxin [Candidatus Korarchaeota archaeon]
MNSRGVRGWRIPRATQVYLRLRSSEPLEWAEIVIETIGAMELLSIENFGAEVFEFACRHNLTIYDASYVYTAIKHNFDLVTDDEKMRRVAQKYVKVLGSDEL